MNPNTRRKTSDALAIIDRRHFRGRPRRQRALAVATLNARIAQEIYALRVQAGLTQRQLAKLVGTTDSAISRLEDADYSGHSLRILERIGAAMDRQLEVRFVKRRDRRKSA